MYSTECRLCPRHAGTNSVCQPSEKVGSGGTVLVLDETPRSGKSRQVLDQALSSAGVTDYYYTSLVKCTDYGGEKPETSEIKACRHYLDQELSAFKPKFILTLGASVLKAMTGKAKITEMAGQVIEKDGRTVVPCYSPSFILRDPSKAPEFSRIIKRFNEVAGGKSLEQKKIRVRIIDRSNLEEFVQAFSQEDEFTYDLETSGLDHYNPDSFINCIGFYLPKNDTAWVLPVRKSPTLPESAIQKLIEKLVSFEKKAIGHNVKFDSLWIRRKMGVHFNTHFDTMLAHHLLDENSQHGLKYLARTYLNAPDYDVSLDEKLGKGDAKKLFEYCGWDCYYTYELKKLFAKELMQDKPTRDLFYKMMIPTSRLFEEIECEGHHVLMDKFSETEVYLKECIEKSLKELTELIGREINWNSPKQVAEVLYGQLGMEPRVFTDTGAPSSGEAALAELDHPVVKMLIDYRSYQKMLSTYIEGWKEFMVKDKLFLSTKLHGTVTGRFSSRLHQVPRDGTIRNLISAPPGWTFVQADLSQAELRVIALVSKDKELIKCYNVDIDVHWRTAMGTLSLGGGENGKLAIETCKLYCLRHGLPQNRASLTILRTLWEAGERKESIEESIKEAREAGSKTLEGSGSNLQILRNLLPSFGTCAEILQFVWSESQATSQDSTIPGVKGSGGLHSSSTAELHPVWSSTSKEGSLLHFLSQESEVGVSDAIPDSQGSSKESWSGEWRKSRGTFKSILEGGDLSFQAEGLHERFMRSLWIYSILSSTPSGSEPEEQPAIELPDAVSLMSSLGPSITKGIRKEWGEIRKQSKATNFGFAYGMGSRKFCEYAKVKYDWEVSTAEAEDIRNAFFSTYAFLTSWHERQRSLVKVDGYVRNLAGRKRRLPGIHSPDGSLRAECERQAINAPIQGFIGDFKTMAMLSLAGGIPDRSKLRIKGEVHDSVLMWVKNEYLSEILPQIKYCMENPPLIRELGIELPVPILVDIEVGVWGAGKTWKGN